MSTVTVKFLKERLHYHRETGVFTWKKSRRIKPGSRAGYSHPSGYRSIYVGGKSHREHRLAWLYVYGVWPRGEVDHINGQKDDNRLINLREATRAQNLANRSVTTRNRCGFKGVSKERNHYRAEIQVEKRRIYLGVFKTAEAAHAAYVEAANKYCGQFARPADPHSRLAGL